jgi:hypothetical protein
MSLEIGSRLGSYRITGVLGAGGMGVVYRAEDSSLGREVALKVLPVDVAGDRERLARFAREARVLAALDHPNIGMIYGWESSTGTPALVLELVEGPTLRERLIAGPLRLDEALGIARQIADAVESAHEQGVIHRDLKPANIKIRPDGRVKVLDFGLAKAIDRDGFDGATETGIETRSGIAIGTPAYMSPEQARGDPLTRRTDVWSFGVILFEMLSGRHPFGGGSSTEVISEILHASPDWGLLPAGTPPSIVRLVRRCLEKDPRARLRDIGDARLELEDSAVNRAAASDAAGGSGSHPSSARGSSRAVKTALAVAAAVAVMALIAGAYWLGTRRSASPAAPETRLSLLAPPETRFASTPAISPDGRTIVFVAAKEGAPTELWIRSLASPTATVLPGTGDGSYPFWNPNGRSIGFFAQGKMKQISIGGDAQVTTICDAVTGRGGAWLEDGTIVFAPAADGALKRVPASGGTAADFTTLDTDHAENSHRFPFELPGGLIMYFIYKNADVSGMRLASIDAPNTPLQFYADLDAAQYVDGYLIGATNGQLRAQRMHLPDGALTGDVIPIGNVDNSETAGRSVWSLGPGGVIAFMVPAAPPSQLTWRDRDGRVFGTLGPVGQYHGVELSLKREKLVTQAAGGELSIIDAARATVDQVIRPGGGFPVWSPDGTRIAVMGSLVGARAGSETLLSIPATGPGKAEPMTASGPNWQWPVGWTPDNQTIVWIGNSRDIESAPPGHPDRATMYLQEGRNPEGRLSPDGHWIAYSSDPDPTGQGRFEVVIQRFPTPGPRYVVSTQGGRFPRWRADGRELFFLSGATLMAANVTLGDAPAIGAPHPLFEPRLVPQRDALALVFRTYEYDVGDAAGTKFLLNQQVREPIRTLDVVLNWKGK